jgi:very-short-patch-repair endonuclease
LGVQFRRHVPLGGRYIADFFAGELGLVAEIEDGYHARFRARADERRTPWLERRGSRCCAWRTSWRWAVGEFGAAVALIRAQSAARRS